MAYESGALNAALAAAVGSDPELVAELRGAALQEGPVEFVVLVHGGRVAKAGAKTGADGKGQKAISLTPA